jgi:peroxiredoxin
MKRTLFLSVTLFISLLTVSAQEQTVYPNGYIVKTGDQAPDFIINEAGGKSYKLSDLKGKVVMLQFTASWCSVCRKEMPFIEDELWSDSQKDGLVIIGIDRDEPIDKVLDFKKEMKITYPLALDPGAEIFALYALKTEGVTRNIIIDREGKIIFLTRLFERDEFNKMKEIIFKELKNK